MWTLFSLKLAFFWRQDANVYSKNAEKYFLPKDKRKKKKKREGEQVKSGKVSQVIHAIPNNYRWIIRQQFF